MNVRDFLADVAAASGNDYSVAFKLLGLVVFVSEEGVEPLLSGRLVSPQTFYRWAESLRLAGWGGLLTDARLRQAVREFLELRLGSMPLGVARDRTIEAVRRAVEEEEVLSPQAPGRRASEAVKGLAEGREAKQSALDGGATGGSLQKATAPSR